MPRMTGSELLKQVRGNYPAMLSIMVMANRDCDPVQAWQFRAASVFAARKKLQHVGFA